MENFMCEPLNKDEIELSIQRIKELRPLYRVKFRNLFPFFDYCCKLRIMDEKEKKDAMS